MVVGGAATVMGTVQSVMRVLELLSEWCVCVFPLSVDLQGVCSVQM